MAYAALQLLYKMIITRRYTHTMSMKFCQTVQTVFKYKYTKFYIDSSRNSQVMHEITFSYSQSGDNPTLAGKGIDTSGNAADVGTLKVHKKVKLIQIAMQTKLAFSQREGERGRELHVCGCTHTHTHRHVL